MKKIVIESCKVCPYCEEKAAGWCYILKCYIIKSGNEPFMANCPLSEDNEVEMVKMLRRFTGLQIYGNMMDDLAALLARIEKEGQYESKSSV